MKPEQFIREFGVEKAREVVESASENHNKFDITLDKTVEAYKVRPKLVDLHYLKRLVESLETIESWGGIESCKEIVHRATSNQVPPEKSFARKLQMDVANYESIYGGGDE